MRITVLGAGIIGLACADELLRRGHDVTVVDPAPGSGASYAAAGMLTPSAELWHGEEALLSLGQRSLALWPGFADRLGVGLHQGGTLLVGLDSGDRQLVRRQTGLLSGLGHRTEVVEPADIEPRVSTRTTAGAWLPDEPSVDPRSVVAALLRRVPVVAEAPESSEVTVVATGARLPAPYDGLLRMRGVRGEIVRAHSDDPPEVVVRGWVRGRPIYVVPRASGEVVLGATMEEHDSAPVVTVGGIARLLADARELVPGLETAVFLEAMARDRPATTDNLPAVGPTHVPGVLLAGGHFRHGVLLAPLTAQLIAHHIETGSVDPVTDPRRFP